jgi:hypothetical protein
MCYVRCPSHVARSAVTQFAPNSCYLTPLRSKYSPRHSVHKHMQFMFLLSQAYKTTGKIIVLYILIFTYLDSGQEVESFSFHDIRHSSNFIWFQFLHECNFYLVVSFPNALCYDFVLNSGDETSISTSSFSAFTSIPTILLASNLASLFFYGIYVFHEWINYISIDKKLMRSIQLQCFLGFLRLANGIF